MTLTDLQEDHHREVVLRSMAKGRIRANLPPGYAHSEQPARFPLADRTPFSVSILDAPADAAPGYYVSTGTSHFYVLSTL